MSACAAERYRAPNEAIKSDVMKADENALQKIKIFCRAGVASKKNLMLQRRVHELSNVREFLGADLVLHVVLAPDQRVDVVFDNFRALLRDERIDDAVKRTVSHENGRAAACGRDVLVKQFRCRQITR